MTSVPLSPTDATLPKVTVRRQTASGRVALTLFVIALIALVAMPWWAKTGTIRMILELCCYIAVAQMWNMLAGYAGLVSVGQQAFMGAAGYAMFVLAQTFGVNPFLAIFLSLLVPAALAVPCYLLLHRLDGPYFAIGTWVVAEVFRLVASNMGWLNAGAGMSLNVMKDYSGFERNVAMSLLCALLILATIGGSYWFLRSRYGLALIAIRDNPVAAASQGVNVGRLRFMIYVAAAVGCGLAGAVYFMAQLRINPPSAFDPMWSNVAIFIVMVGGIASIEGVLIGTLIYFIADRWFGEYGASYFVVLGVMTVLVALYARTGIWGAISKRWDAPWFPISRHLILKAEDRA
ncbi:branched-chain amino acid ABC transporter permease [Tabrizicola fusiformis]|uniref:branched-chain amino acid ABC transporter permease n=1 Tax=Tabrizicola sp. SY72 TaxID=2741673 RepID=UPI00157184E5|nr:branched-chain amino acid ABC transporter permease [Tabrizicola sp. SY72]NTT88049.1 branched-chain amino acid ABC transporter permease [Tabrizicola sp. SY72]